jgi:cell division septation protein DedD
VKAKAFFVSLPQGFKVAILITSLVACLTVVIRTAWILSAYEHKSDASSSARESDHVAEMANGDSNALEDVYYKRIGSSPKANHRKAKDAIAEGFTLEISMSNSRKAAETVVNKLAQKGVRAFYTPLTRQGKVIYRVRLGIFHDRSEAAFAAKKLFGQHQVKSRVAQL